MGGGNADRARAGEAGSGVGLEMFEHVLCWEVRLDMNGVIRLRSITLQNSKYSPPG